VLAGLAAPGNGHVAVVVDYRNAFASYDEHCDYDCRSLSGLGVLFGRIRDLLDPLMGLIQESLAGDIGRGHVLLQLVQQIEQPVSQLRDFSMHARSP
jgi:hypothetical protein